MPIACHAGPGGILYGGKWDVITFNWGGDSIGELSNLYSCDQIPPKGQNVPRYCNRDVDRALDRFMTTYDEAEQRAATRVIQTHLRDDVPTIVLDVREDLYAYNHDLHGFRPNQVTPFDDMLNVDI